MKKRHDGVYIKNINPYQKLMPHLMPHRHDSMNATMVDIRCEPMDNFIRMMNEQGEKYSYIDIIVAALVRLFARRPALNRFVMNRRIYMHKDITISFVIKKKMVDDSEDTTVKLHFTGEEDIATVRDSIKKVIEENRGDSFNDVDKTAQILASAPHWMMKLGVGFLGWLDKHNMLPKSIIETSPFHNSMFITFMKSIKGDAILHHCYNFGTTGIFIAVGKEKQMPVVENGELAVGKVMQLGVVMDERFCDGLYFVNSFRLLTKILANPALLLKKYDLNSEVHAQHGVRSEEDIKKYKQLAKQRRRKKS
jgi:hypothetical protein